MMKVLLNWQRPSPYLDSNKLGLSQKSMGRAHNENNPDMVELEVGVGC